MSKELQERIKQNKKDYSPHQLAVELAKKQAFVDESTIAQRNQELEAEVKQLRAQVAELKLETQSLNNQLETATRVGLGIASGLQEQLGHVVSEKNYYRGLQMPENTMRAIDKHLPPGHWTDEKGAFIRVAVIYSDNYTGQEYHTSINKHYPHKKWTELMALLRKPLTMLIAGVPDDHTLPDDGAKLGLSKLEIQDMMLELMPVYAPTSDKNREVYTQKRLEYWHKCAPQIERFLTNEGLGRTMAQAQIEFNNFFDRKCEQYRKRYEPYKMTDEEIIQILDNAESL